MLLGGIGTCEIAPGKHSYARHELTLTAGGEFTVRLVGTDPTFSDVAFLAASGEFTDPYLAVYSTFDPADAHDGLVGAGEATPVWAFVGGGVLLLIAAAALIIVIRRRRVVSPPAQ